ncbi:MAG: hypothetical protein M3325_02400 [Actinomycetota bacterium]|nr:hypothetical protein [Actinomycetota bacterium]
MMGDDVQAKKLLGRSRDELARANLNEAPDWARFYNETDMYAMTGTVYKELAAFEPPCGGRDSHVRRGPGPLRPHDGP